MKNYVLISLFLALSSICADTGLPLETVPYDGIELDVWDRDESGGGFYGIALLDSDGEPLCGVGIDELRECDAEDVALSFVEEEEGFQVALGPLLIPIAILAGSCVLGASMAADGDGVAKAAATGVGVGAAGTPVATAGNLNNIYSNTRFARESYRLMLGNEQTPYETVTRREWIGGYNGRTIRVRAVSLRMYHRHLWSYPEVRAAVTQALFATSLRLIPAAGVVGTACYGVSKIFF